MTKTFILSQRQTSASQPLKWRVFFWIWNLAWVTGASLVLGVLSLYLAPVDLQAELFQSYLENPYILAFNVLPVVLLALFLYFCTGRAPLAYWITAALVGITTTVNFFKLLFRNDPFLFADVLLWKEASKMTGEYTLYFTKTLAGALIVTLVLGALLHIFARGRLKGQTRYRFFGIALCLLVAVPLFDQIWDDGNYTSKTANNTYINQWSTTEVYYSKGFVYPFLYSAKSAFTTPPDGYDASYAVSLLDAYPSVDIPEDQKVSVISIMLEAYADFSQYDVDGLQDKVYEDYHALEAESYTGTLLVNIFAGGTVDSERCYLTGYANLPNFRSDTNSYPWYFQEQGYTVTGAHPCYQWFYNRENINQYLGFDDYWFVENYYTEMTNGNVAYDSIFFPSLIDMWEDNLSTGQPLFAYNLNYQGHGPYSSEVAERGEGYVISDQYSQASMNIMNSYFGSLYDTNQYLVEFFDYYREAEEPVIIVLFGDHKPWFGDGNSVYAELGMDFDLSTKEGFYEYYSTSYLIWANDAAKETLGNDFVGEGPDISANYLMNQVFQLAGWTGPTFLQATNQVMEQVPMQNTATGLFLEDGQLTDSLSPEGQQLVSDFQIMEYYWQTHFIG